MVRPRQHVARLAVAVVVALGWGCTQANPEYDPDAAAAACTSGQRRCAVDNRPQVCVRQADGTDAWADDFCPRGGKCQDGHCAPPAGAMGCSRNSDCGAEVCVVFVSGIGLGRFCAPVTGTQLGGSPCGDPRDCSSGMCQTQGHGAPLCYFACAGQDDCTGAFSCTSAEVTISGVRGQVEGCMLP
jgi:hypothetical protein